jgi:hypothetical protein
MASLLAAMPSWRHLDPMPILAEQARTARAAGDEPPRPAEDPGEKRHSQTEAKVAALFDR